MVDPRPHRRHRELRPPLPALRRFPSPHRRRPPGRSSEQLATDLVGLVDDDLTGESEKVERYEGGVWRYVGRRRPAASAAATAAARSRTHSLVRMFDMLLRTVLSLMAS